MNVIKKPVPHRSKIVKTRGDSGIHILRVDPGSVPLHVMKLTVRES